MKVGYQGIEGSNSYKAAKKMVDKLKLNNIIFVPLVSSSKVVDMLKENKIDYGVVAIRNNIGGKVKETYEAINNQNIKIISNQILSIHHCLFVKNSNILKNKITAIYSHPQALKQCVNNIHKYLGDIELKEIEDTAIGARYLFEDKLDKNAGILCRKNAGEKYNLNLLFENIEDSKNNETEFCMFKII